MRWPEGVTIHDDRLTESLVAADEWLTDVVVHDVLRHVPGRRLTARASSGDRPVVVKVFRSQRARGNHRRLSALAAAGLADLVPQSLGHDPSGRVGLLDFRPGTVFDQLPDGDFVITAHRAGVALRRLHDCGAELDREWTVTDEIEALQRRATEATRPFVEELLRRLPDLEGGPIVPSHRDCHPRQLVTDGSTVHWIDLDDCTFAPAGLDVGNMAAHLTREGLIGRRSTTVASDARHAFIAGYGWMRARSDLAAWELLSLARLAGLAESRHGSPAQRDALLAAAHSLMAPA